MAKESLQQCQQAVSAVMLQSRSRVIPIPDEMGLDEAAAMPVTYLTAHHMLHYLGHLKKGETVLIHGGAGG